MDLTTIEKEILNVSNGLGSELFGIPKRIFISYDIVIADVKHILKNQDLIKLDEFCEMDDRCIEVFTKVIIEKYTGKNKI
jgi:hypothetical protein